VVREPRRLVLLGGLALLGALLVGALVVGLDPGVRSDDRGASALGADLPEFSPFSVGPLVSPRSSPGLGPARGSVALPAARRRELSSAYGRLPLAFEVNRGQNDPRVRFASRGNGYALALTERGPTLSVARHGAHGGHGAPAAALGMGFVGGRRTPVVGSGRLPSRVNYLIGKDPRRWHTGVPTYSEVSYRGVWSGIDVSFYGHQRQLEYDFRLRPHADPGQITLKLSGARHLRLDHRGDLVIGLRGGTVRELAPRGYQRIAGGRKAVASRYVLLPGHRVAVRVGSYDRRRPLVIDPALTYATYLGGSGVDFADAGSAAVDSADSLYLGGVTFSSDFPATPGAFQPTSGGARSIGYVAKLNPTGSAFDYVTYVGGGKDSSGNPSAGYIVGLAVDSAGDAYVEGATNSVDFPVTTGALQATNAGGQDAVVAKLNPTGSALIYSTYLGGSGDDLGFGIALDAGGDTYVAGSTTSTNFPTTAGALQTTGGGAQDGFVAKLNPSGSALAYSTYLGGRGEDGGQGIALDGRGDAYVTGLTNSTDFPTTAGAPQRAFGGGAHDAFIAKLDPTASALAYSTYLGGSDDDVARGIAVDASGGAYVIGYAVSSDFPTTAGAFQPTFGGGTRNAFVAGLNPDGSRSYVTYLGGAGRDVGWAIAVDGVGAAYVVGGTTSTNFPLTPDAFQPTYGGSGGGGATGTGDGFVAKLTPRGSALVYSTYLGGSAFDLAIGVAVDGTGNAYVIGSTSSTNFPTTPGSAQPAKNPNNDVFAVKMPTPSVLRSTSTAVSCSPGTVLLSSATSCTATVTDTDGGPTSTPSGTVTFATSQSGGFGSGASCTVSATSTAGPASCPVSYTPSAAGSGTHTITASYGADARHATSAANTTVGVSAPGGNQPAGNQSGGNQPPPRRSPALVARVTHRLLPNLTCVDHRRFSFPVHQARSANGNVIRVTVYVGRKKVKTVTGTNLRKVTITRLPRGRFTVKLVTVTAKNVQITSTRTYRACRKGQRSELKRKHHHKRR